MFYKESYLTGFNHQKKRYSYEQESKVLKGWLYRGLYRGGREGLLRGILGASTRTHVALFFQLGLGS